MINYEVRKFYRVDECSLIAKKKIIGRDES